MSREECLRFAKQLANLYVVHPGVEEVWRTLESMRMSMQLTNEPRDSGHLFLWGRGGLGKSESMKNYARKFEIYEYVTDRGTKVRAKPVIYGKCPFPFTEKNLFINILEALDVPLLKASANINDLKRYARVQLEKQRVQVLILDELNFLANTPRMPDVVGMEHLKAITDWGVGLVCVGTQVIRSLRQLDEQYQSRFQEVPFPSFENVGEFVPFLQSVERELNPPYPLWVDETEIFSDFMYKWSDGGNLRKFHRLLRTAYELVGLFEPNFDDLSKAKVDIEVFQEAYRLVKE